MFNFNRTFFDDRTTALVSPGRRSLEDRQRDVYDSHRHRVFAVAYYMFGNEVHAEEALKKTFVRAFQAIEEPDARCIDAALMDELREHISFDNQPPLVNIPAQACLGSRNVRRTDLEEAIGELPAMERLAFLLKDVEGYATEAISELTGIPVSSLPGVLLSARLRLRAVLASDSKPAAQDPGKPSSKFEAA